MFSFFFSFFVGGGTKSEHPSRWATPEHDAGISIDVAAHSAPSNVRRVSTVLVRFALVGSQPYLQVKRSSLEPPVTAQTMVLDTVGKTEMADRGLVSSVGIASGPVAGRKSISIPFAPLTQTPESVASTSLRSLDLTGIIPE